MDNKTRITLEQAGAETQHIVIYNDSSLNNADLRPIADAIASAHKLKDLTVSGCNLNDHALDILAPVISKHPSLTRINLSRNNFYDVKKAIPIVRKTTVHSLDLSEGHQVCPKSFFEQFLFAALDADSIVELKITINPSRYDSWNINEFGKYFNRRWQNLLLFTTSESRPSIFCQEIIDGTCSENRAKAEGLLKRVETEKISSVSEIEQLNKRLSSVIYLAEIQSKRDQIIAKLTSINEVALHDHGMGINVSLYLTENDTPGMMPVAIMQEPSPDLPTIRSVSKGLPTLSEESIRAQIEEGRSNPLRLMELGQDIVGGVGNIALASLHATTSTTSLEIPVRSMADFLEKFAEAKHIIEEHAGRAPTVTALPVKAKKGFLVGIRKKLFGQAQELHSLADAGVLAQQAGQVLQDMIPSLLGMEGRLAGQLTTTHQVIDAYQHISDQIKLIRKVGQELLGSWRQESTMTIDFLPSDSSPQTGPEEPFHVQSLEARLDFLTQIEDQVKGHVARHMLHGAIEQKQQQGVSSLRGQNIPLIAEQVATFMRQVEELQRAEVINSLANATREATGSEGDTYVFAARNTIAAIENLAGSTQQALANMGKASDQITSQIGPVEASGVALPPPRQEARPT